MISNNQIEHFNVRKRILVKIRLPKYLQLSTLVLQLKSKTAVHLLIKKLDPGRLALSKEVLDTYPSVILSLADLEAECEICQEAPLIVLPFKDES